MANISKQRPAVRSLGVVMFALAMIVAMVVRMLIGAADKEQGSDEESKKRLHSAGAVVALQLVFKRI